MIGRLALVFALLIAAPAAAQERPARPTPFDQGQVSLSAGGSLSSSGDDTYFVLGLGAGYYVARGLEASLGSAVWIGRDPFVAQLTPGLRYVLWMVPTVHPYLGSFYRHWFVFDGQDDINAVGGRAGVVVTSGGPFQVNAGVVYEHILSACDDCGRFYPELSFAIVF